MANENQNQSNGESTVRQELQAMAAQFKAALPPHITPERFTRVVLTAVNSNPDIAQADRRSLYEAAMKAAQDGLLPDGREAAFVVYNTKVTEKGKPDRWIKKAQYLPMVNGLIKKIYNSGQIATIEAAVVYENEEFNYELGDNASLSHKPKLTGDKGKPILAYAIAKTKDGSIFREVMTAEEINAVREVSRAKDSGPWAGSFYTEMWKKSVVRRLSKRLPMSTDIETVIKHDDETYELNGDAVHELPMPQRQSLSAPEGGENQEREAGQES